MAFSSDVVPPILEHIYVELLVRIAIQISVSDPKWVVTVAFSCDVVHIILWHFYVELFVRIAIRTRM